MVTFDKPQAENTQNTQTFSTGNARFANIYRQNVAAYKNMLRTLPNMTENERDWAYSYDMWKFMSDNVNDIYRGVEDPREALSDEVVGTMIHNLYPNISKENAVRNARSIVKGMTGDDMSSSNVIEVAFEKVKNGFASLGAGFQNLRYIFEHGESDDPEINAQRLKDQQAMLNAKIGNLKRTDYYNKDFDSFIDKMVLAAADFIPSEIASFVPTAVGGALSALTGNPLFFSLGSVISGGLAGVMEAGSTSVELAQAGAPISSQMGFSTIVGLANGTLEWLGNVAERGTVESIFNLKKLYKEVGDNQIAKMTARDFGRHLATEYAVNLVSEPTTEGLQELTSLFVMNLASEWQKKNVGKSFSEEFTYSPQEMAKNVFDTVKETFRGQMLIGLGGGVMDTVSNLTYHLDTSEGIRNWKWEAGQLKQALDANKYCKASANSIFVDNKNVVVNEGVRAYEPTYTTGKKGNQKADQIEPVKAIRINNKLVPINTNEMSKAKYMAENSKYGMYVEIVDNQSVDAESVSKLEAQTIINSLLPDEIGGHAVDYMYKENGDIVIENKADMDAIIMALAQNAKNINNIQALENGYTVTLGDKNITFTTDAEGGELFNQSDYMRQAVDEIRNKAKEEIDNDWNKRIEDIQERSERMKATERRIKESNFRTEINKVVDSMITDKDLRKEEKKKITEAVNRIAKEAEKAFTSASENSATFKNILGDTDVSTASKSFARGTVMAVAKLAQSMNMNVSDFMDKVNFKFSEVSNVQGKERAGWTQTHSDGTFDVYVTNLLDQTTGIHEMSHVYLTMLGDNYKGIEGFLDNYAEELKKDGSIVGRETQEAFARDLEKYVNEGVAKSEGLRKVFDLVLDALRNFVNAVRSILSPEKVAMFDNLFEKGIKNYKQTEQAGSEDTFFAKDFDTDGEFQRQYDEVVAKYKDADKWLKAPNGKDSNLDERLWVTVRTDNFKKWFGDWENDPENASKVVDENGEPLVVTHHTNNKFDTFKVGSGNAYAQGMYFADDRFGIDLDQYGNKEMECFLNIRNPMETANADYLYESDIEALKEKIYSYFDNKLKDAISKYKDVFDNTHEANIRRYIDNAFDRIENNTVTALDALAFLQSAVTQSINPDAYKSSDVYDVLSRRIAEIFKSVTGFDGAVINRYKWYVAFERNQIKSVDNIGTFSNDTGNIYFKDAYDYMNDWFFNVDRIGYDIAYGDGSTQTKLSELSVGFINSVLDMIKDDWADTDVDINKIDRTTCTIDFLDGEDAASVFVKLYKDPLATVYDTDKAKYATIPLPTGQTMKIYLTARTDNKAFDDALELMLNEPNIKKQVDKETENNLNKNISNIADAFVEVEKLFPQGVRRLTFAGGASRYSGPEYNQSTKYLKTGYHGLAFGWGTYNSAVIGIAEHYAEQVSREKGFGQSDTAYVIDRFYKKYYGDLFTMSNQGPKAMREVTGYGQLPYITFDGHVGSFDMYFPIFDGIIARNISEIVEHGKRITKQDILDELTHMTYAIEDADVKEEYVKGWENFGYRWTDKYGESFISEYSKEEAIHAIEAIRDDIAYDYPNFTTRPIIIEKPNRPEAYRTVHTNVISGDDEKFFKWDEKVSPDLFNDIYDALFDYMYRFVDGNSNLKDMELVGNIADILTPVADLFGMDIYGWQLYNKMATIFGSKYFEYNEDYDDTGYEHVSRILKNVGFEGVKYIAERRRKKADVQYNYVIFDDSFVKSIREDEFDEEGNRIDTRNWIKNSSPLYFKDADIDMTENEVADKLGKGEFVPNEVLDKYENHPFVKMERLVQNIVATKPEWFKLFKRAVDEYLVDTGMSHDDFGKWNYREILKRWNNKLKGISNYMELPVDTDGDYILFLRRLNAYANMESPERAETAWMDTLKHTRNGRENIRNLAKQMDKLGLFNDKLEGYDISARFPALNMIANKTSGSEKRGTRPRIDVSVYDQALDEAFRNRDYIRSQLNDENTNTYESNMKDIDSETNYMESEEILNILKDKDVSPEIKNIIKNGVFTGTVVRDLMKDADERLRKLRSQNRTIDLVNREIEVLRERTNLYEKEIEDLENGISHKNMAQMVKLREKLAEAKEELRNLAKEKVALADRLATEVLAGALYKTKRQVQDIVNSNSGEADVNRALRETVNEVINYYRKKARKPDREVTVRLNEMKYRLDEDGQPMKDDEGNTIPGKAPELAKFLEDNDMVDENGKLIKGFEDLNVAQLKAFRKAVKTDKENTKSRQKENQRVFEANVQSLAGRIVSTMKPRKLEKTLSADDRKEINEEVNKRTEGRFVSDAERRQIESEVLGEFLSSKIQEIADGAVYGIESHTEAVNKKKNIIDDFTTLSRLLRQISPELEKFVMNGLNKMTDAKYRNTDSRMKTFFNNIKEMYKLKNDKELQKFLNTFVTDRRDIGRATEEELPERLKKNKLFMEMWEADEKSGKNSQVHKFQFSIQDLMAIEEQSLEWDGLRHLNKGCGISAAEIAWTVNQFESEGGSLEKYKPAADEIRRVYGERFQQIYDTVLSAENREMLKVSFYSPMFGVGLDKDLTMKFSDVFSDDKSAQANWFTKDREFGTNAIDLNYYSRLQKVVEMQEAYINGAEFYRQLDHLFSEKGGNLRNIITEVYGSPAFKRIETMLDLTKTDAVRNIITEADNMASTIRNHYVMARLAYNMSSVFQQVGSWFLGLSKYGLVDLWKASMQFIAHPITMSNRVYELSPQMKHAVNPLIRMAYETAKPNPTTALGKVDKFVSSIGEKGLVLMEKQDHIIRNILWWTAYQKEVANAQEQIANVNNSTSLTDEQKNGKVNEIMEQAQRNATQWVLDIQSSSQVKDNSLMYSGGNLFWKQVLMFTNQLNKEWNMLYVDGIKEGLFQKQYGKFFANMAALGLSTMFIVAITGKIKNDEDDDETWAEDLLKDWGIEFASRVPIVGNTVKNVYEGFAYKQSDDVVSRLTQLIAKLANEKADTKQKMTALRNFGWSGLDLFGAPTTAAKRIYQAFEDGRIYEADHFMRLLGGEWYKYFEE